MALTSRFSYQRLRHHDEEKTEEIGDRERVVNNNFVMRRKRWSRLRKVHIKIKRVKVRMPWFLRWKARVFMVRWARVLKRLKESQSHFGDLFGGNYLFFQVDPTPLKTLQSSSSSSSYRGGLKNSTQRGRNVATDCGRWRKFGIAFGPKQSIKPTLGWTDIYNQRTSVRFTTATSNTSVTSNSIAKDVIKAYVDLGI